MFKSALVQSHTTMPSIIAIIGSGVLLSRGILAQNLPESAQIINQKSFNVLEFVPPPTILTEA
jgi:gluconolactonase